MTAASPYDALEFSGTGRPDFREFFAAHHDQIVRSLSLALGDDQLGRDAAAEGFTRALARWNRVGTMVNPPGWVYRVGLNWARSRRRKTRREVSESRLAERADPRSTPVEPDDRRRFGRVVARSPLSTVGGIGLGDVVVGLLGLFGGGADEEVVAVVTGHDAGDDDAGGDQHACSGNARERPPASAALLRRALDAVEGDDGVARLDG